MDGSRQDEQSGYRGDAVDSFSTDMSAYNRGRMRRQADDHYQQRQADSGGGGGGMIFLLGAAAVVAGVFVILPYIIAWAVAAVAITIALRIALPAMGAKTDTMEVLIATLLAFCMGALAVALLIGAGTLSLVFEGPVMTPVFAHLDAGEHAGDFYAPYFAPGWYLVTAAKWHLIPVALLLIWVAGRSLNRSLPDTSLRGFARALLLGLLALAAYAAALFAAAKWFPGYFYYDHRDYLVEEVTTVSLSIPEART